jgi:hypothetical protein
MINPFMQVNMNSLKVDSSGRVPETTTSALQGIALLFEICINNLCRSTS